MGQVHFSYMRIFPLGGVSGTAPPSVNLGPPYISETVRARKLKFYTHIDRVTYTFWYEIFSTRGRL